MVMIHNRLFMEVFNMSITKRISVFFKCLLFVIITILVVNTVNEVMEPKYFFSETWPMTNTYSDFYKLEKNSVDVLMLGSSHAVSSFNPQVIYDNFNITSYNLGSTQQSPLITYYWLKEALKYQSPKVVILDTLTFFKYTGGFVYNGMNCAETSVRKAMDSMRFSPLKIEAAKNIVRYDESQNALSYFLTNIRYHSRWMMLDENDFSERAMLAHGGVKGFATLGGKNPGKEYLPFSDDESVNVEPEEMVDVAKEYIGKTIELCNQEGIELVFVKIPCFESIERYKSAKEYAQANGVPFIDFNEESMYNAISYDAAEDRLSHPNYHGAEKISMYLGQMLQSEYGIAPREDKSFEKSGEVYARMVENISLYETEDIYQYLSMLDNSRYSTFVFAGKKFSKNLNDDLLSAFNSLGFTADLKNADKQTHYVAVKDGNSVFEKMTKDNITERNSIRNGKVVYSFNINTDNMDSGNHTYSLIIDKKEYCNMPNGINIVVYDNEFKHVIDSINIDTNSEELEFTRFQVTED